MAQLFCCCPLPDAVTAEEETEEEDTDACPKDDPVDVDRQVLEGDGHGAGVIGVNQAQTTEAPWRKSEEWFNEGKRPSVYFVI